MPNVAQSRAIRLATRASPLALWQARHIASLLESAIPHAAVELVEVSTQGDRDRDSRLAEMGGLGVFTREVQVALLDGRADVAVHSLKDLPTEAAPGLLLAGVPARGPRWDAAVAPRGREAPTVAAIPPGASVATGSLRRRAQLLHLRPDLVMCDVRGNVQTRLDRLDAGEYDLLILALAGLERLEELGRPLTVLKPPQMYPAVGQAALGLECRADDAVACEALGRITDAATLAEVLAERACLRALRAGCHAPVATLATCDNAGFVALEAIVLSADGRERLHVSIPAAAAPEDVGQAAAEELLRQGAARLLEPARS